ncbi:TIGR04211 family SH3 domain-containing protein [Salinimonas sediminis]|uniref:TIGR04211 family SH3 domain-containing protein n=1 Tax=Salinimonas sediminis TaxID=2303538 RepID=A0A346NIG1_9ALTE|nr:TIGR04211 family SH3 domain-containing protein [Salinimonas sediminis]AXR05318.1 TIGR04211 family SH3 domain-containing protein [Salinimonas sediminis]
MLRKWLTVMMIAFSFQAFGLQDTPDLEPSSSHYIRDDLFVFIHTGPGRNYRILGSIEAGTPITILKNDRDAEFMQIRDHVEDRTGWVESKYVSDQMSRAEQLPIISQKLADSQASQQGLQSENGRLKRQLSEARQELSTLSSQTDEQSREIKKLSTQLDNQEKDEMIKWFTRGGMVAGAGILLGVILTYLPKKRGRNSEWV